jgi:shikimate kinase
MKRVLITGLSGTGKSTALERLRALGHKAVDTDEGLTEWVPLASNSKFRYSDEDGEWLWREDRVQELLSTEDSDVLFISGCARNQGKFYSQFDHVILFTAPAEVMAERMRTRTNNPYGQRPEEVALHLELKVTLEPRLRRSATAEVDTRCPLDEVVSRVLTVAGL